MAGAEVTVRRAAPADRDAVLALATRALGWAADERDRALFTWKHDENPAGPSPAWVATVDDEVVGFRTLQRWRFTGGLTMVRAVDTATDPAHQGRGIFTRLTRRAVDELAAEGVDAVFNTPNDKSRPGYLKMGWQLLGRPTLWAQPRSPWSGVAMLRARTSARRWSEPCTVGVPAADALAAPSPAALVPRRGLAPERTAEHLAWRYGFEPLGYRAVEVKGGLAVFRVRRRGPLREVALCEWLSEQRDPVALRRLVRHAGDYLLALGMDARHGLAPIPGKGPTVLWRPLARAAVPTLAETDFALGDLELF